MPPDTPTDRPVVQRVEEREKLHEKIHTNLREVVEEACVKLDRVALQMYDVKKDTHRTQREVSTIRRLIYTLHPEADPSRTILDKVAEHKVAIITALAAVAGVLMSLIALIKGGA